MNDAVRHQLAARYRELMLAAEDWRAWERARDIEVQRIYDAAAQDESLEAMLVAIDREVDSPP